MTSTGRHSKRHWASGPDQMMAGSRHSGLFSKVKVPDPAVLADALATIVAAGPHTRLGLTPEPGKRVWRYDPQTKIPLRPLPDDVLRAGDAAILEYLRVRPGDHRPFEVYYAPEHLAFDIEHGIGDGMFVHDVTNALFALSNGAASRWVSHGDTRLAMPRTLFHTFAKHPARARAAVRQAVDLRSLRASRLASGPDELVPWSPSFAAAIAYIDVDAESAVEEWRRAQSDKSGGAATWLYIARNALRAAGIPMTETVMVPFGCRRYLPDGGAANGNFMVGLDLPFASQDTVPEVGKRLREYTVSAVPLAGLGAVSALALLKAGGNSEPPTTRAIDPVARITYSDIGIVTALDNLPWLDHTDRSHVGFMDPSTPEGISVLSSRVGPTRRIVISFHDNIFDRAVIDSVISSLENPAQFLP